jgi:hypothetical protein
MDGWMDPSFFGQKKNLFSFPPNHSKNVLQLVCSEQKFLSTESPQIFGTSGPSFNAMFMDGPH